MNKTVIVWIAALLVQVVFLLLLISPEHIRTEYKKEIKTVVKWFGEEKTAEMYKVSKEDFNKIFVETGVKKHSYKFFLPKTQEETGETNQGINKLRKAKLWGWVEERLDAFWQMMQAGSFRVELLIICLLHCIPILIPSLIDGIAKREISKGTVNNVSLNVYQISKNLLISLLVMPFVLLIWPFAVSPVYVGWWALLLSITAWFTSSNTQHKV